MRRDQELDLERWLKAQENRGRLHTGTMWRDEMRELFPYLRMALPIEEMEKVETVFKQLLRVVLAQELDGPASRFLAMFQRDVGFVVKQKSYALKCASPLGYSIFLQEPFQGFSFQRHITRKTEIFHILQPLDGARVFLCSSDEWNSIYEKTRFGSWLAGHPDAAFDLYSIKPRSGDIFHVDRLGVVHSVLGCILEEFATVSVDMVDRLHDQNIERPISWNIDRTAIDHRLKHLRMPETNTAFLPGNKDGIILRPTVESGVSRIQLSTGDIEATRYVVEPGAAGRCEVDHDRAAQVFVLGGRGQIALGDARELRAGLPSMAVAAGDLLLVPPHCHRVFQAAPDQQLVISEHKIAPALALD